MRDVETDDQERRAYVQAGKCAVRTSHRVDRPHYQRVERAALQLGRKLTGHFYDRSVCGQKQVAHEAERVQQRERGDELGPFGGRPCDETEENADVDVRNERRVEEAQELDSAWS